MTRHPSSPIPDQWNYDDWEQMTADNDGGQADLELLEQARRSVSRTRRVR